MCGIFFYSGKVEMAEQFTCEALKKLEYRGYDSFGIGSLEEGGAVHLQKFIGKVSDENNFKKFKNHKSHLALGHTRWATHGSVTAANAHPHLSYDRRIMLVHNGIFENFQEIKNELLKQKITFKSETDSEVMVNLIAFTMNSNKLDLGQACENAFAQALGSSAFIVIDTKTKEWLVYKNGSALHIGINPEKEIFIASDVSALFTHTNKIYSLQDGEIVNADGVGKLKFKVVADALDLADKGKYKHFTLKEVFDQEWSIEKAYTQTVAFSEKEIQNLKNKNIIFTGCGTAFNVAQMAVYLLAQNGILARAIPANEFESFTETLDKKVVLFAISQSGETADTVLACKMVQAKGGKVYSILNNIYSSIAALSEKVFPIHAGVEIGVVSTKAFSGQIATIFKLFGYQVSKQDFATFANWLQDKNLSDKCKKVAAKYKQRESLYIVGKSLCAPVAYEMALKVKEASYIHAEAFAAGELKHGVISLIEKGTLVIVCDGVEGASRDLENSAIQIHSRGGSLLGIGAENKNYYKDFIQIPQVNNLSVLAVSVVGQLLAYNFTIAKNLDPDKPRNLAKSVTVK
jgi:glucosamine--fructose-6-phosphate aminotransferase (isomerizing)